jgi:uncharacterized protein YjbI with pentapeptide repeats
LLQRSKTENSVLSDSAEQFVRRSIRNRQANRLKFFVIPLILAIFLGNFTTRQIWQWRMWQTISASEGKRYSQARNQAIRELVDNNVDLSGINLENTDLSYADLDYAAFSNANFSNANLDHVSLYCSILYRANLSHASLIDATLGCAMFHFANLSNADLSNADFTSSNMPGPIDRPYSTDFSNANLKNANLSNAKLKGVNFDGADLSRANFGGADFYGSLYTQATKFPKDFDPVSQHMYFLNAGANLENAQLNNIHLWNSNLSGANLRNADLNGANLNGTNFRNANLNGANLRHAYLGYVDLSGANLKDADFRGATIYADVKSAKNWEQALYDKKYLKQLNAGPAIVLPKEWFDGK